MQNTEYEISQHAKTRYAERIMGKDDTGDVNRFVVTNEDKIKEDINKMISYGQCITNSAKGLADGKGKQLDVYLKDTWVIIVDPGEKRVVTLYRIDLGCGDELNSQYIAKMLDKLDGKRKELEQAKTEAQEETENYRDLIEDAKAQIAEYKGMIKNLEDMCAGYETVLKNNSVKVTRAEMDVSECINELIGRKKF